MQVLFFLCLQPSFILSFEANIMNQDHPNTFSSIGVFDSGYGGLTVLNSIVQKLPQYNYIYLGDNARTPYGNRSFEAVYQYTLQCVNWLFDKGCPLVILACNTASAKALRTIQQNDLPRMNDSSRRVLGVIRPTAEVIGNFSQNKKVGILATKGTVASQSYVIEINKLFPDVKVTQEACPMWVPLVENNEHEHHGANYFIKKNIDSLIKKNRKIDTVLLACTHYPLLMKKICEYMPVDIKVVSQGSIVANSLENYLRRHPEIESKLATFAHRSFYTTDSTTDFDAQAEKFYGEKISSEFVEL